jgi:hypothetical protein
MRAEERAVEEKKNGRRRRESEAERRRHTHTQQPKDSACVLAQAAKIWTGYREQELDPTRQEHQQRLPVAWIVIEK